MHFSKSLPQLLTCYVISIQLTYYVEKGITKTDLYFSHK